jgi:DNA-binding LacI/PurR family transcriptional regulator
VSLVFRNAPGPSAETRECVLRAADELGYRPDTAAQVLRRNRSRHIGVLFTMRQPFDVDLVEAIYPAAERRGYHVVLGPIGAGRDDQQAVEELLAYRSEALILDGGDHHGRATGTRRGSDAGRRRRTASYRRRR